MNIVLAVVTFIVGGLGIYTIWAANNGREVITRSIGTIALVAILGFATVSLVSVSPGEVAVVFNVTSGTYEPTLKPGTYFVLPVMQIVTEYNVAQQSMSFNKSDQGSASAILARTNDGQQVGVDATLIFQLDENRITDIHAKWQDRYADQLVRPLLREIVRNEGTTFSGEELYQGIADNQDQSSREKWASEIQSDITEQLAPHGIIVSDFILRDIDFDDNFEKAISNRQVAEQNRQTAVETAEQERILAQGQADAVRTSAQAEADSILIRAAAEAEALRLVNEQLSQNPNLIQYSYVQQLGDNVQVILLPSNNPFLFDFTQLTSPSGDIVSPEVTSEPTTP